jgi:hypothetical protein
VPSRFARFFLAAFFFTFPLFDLGVSVSGYFLSLPMFFLVLYDFSIISTGIIRINKHVLKFASIFLAWAFLITVFRLPLFEFLPSLMVLALLWVPFWLDRPDIDKSHIAVTWFVRGLLLCLAICIYQSLSGPLHLAKIDDLLPLRSPLRATYQISAGGPERLNALMIEPAYLGIYLTFSYAVLDILWEGPAKWKLALKGLTILFLFLTFSISGFAIFLSYMGFKYIVRLRYQKWLRRAAVGALALAVISITVGSVILQTSSGRYLQYRITRITQVLMSGGKDTKGSTGMRLEAIPLAFEYLERGQWVWGEGYGNSDQWVKENRVAQTTGAVHNIYTAVMISTGLVGLGLYGGFIVSLKMPLLHGADAFSAFFFAWLMAAMATGHLVHYYYWGYLYIFYFFRNSSRPSPVVQGRGL